MRRDTDFSEIACDQEVIHMLTRSLGAEENQLMAIKKFLIALQDIHDNSDVRYWEVRLGECEMRFYL